MAGLQSIGRALGGSSLVLLAATLPWESLGGPAREARTPCPFCEKVMICIRPGCPHSYLEVSHNTRFNGSPPQQSSLGVF